MKIWMIIYCNAVLSAFLREEQSNHVMYNLLLETKKMCWKYSESWKRCCFSSAFRECHQTNAFIHSLHSFIRSHYFKPLSEKLFSLCWQWHQFTMECQMGHNSPFTRWLVSRKLLFIWRFRGADFNNRESSFFYAIFVRWSAVNYSVYGWPNGILECINKCRY